MDRYDVKIFESVLSDLFPPQMHKVLAFSQRSDKINFEIIIQYIRRFPDEDFSASCQVPFLC